MTNSPSIKSVKDDTEESKSLTLEVMRTMLYSSNSELNAIKLKPYTGKRTEIIENLLEGMYKLTVLSKAMHQFSNVHISYVQPYFDEKQHLRCYLSDSYIVVEMTTDPKSGRWIHIIENHEADNKESDRYYEFQIVPNLSDETLVNINTCIEMVIETVEHHIFAAMNKTNTIFEHINSIRIGDKTRDEIKREERIRHEERKKLEEEDRKLKKAKRKQFWKKLLFLSPNSISFG